MVLISKVSIVGSDGVSSLGLETRFLKSRPQVSSRTRRISVSSSLSRDFARLLFMKFCKKEFL